MKKLVLAVVGVVVLAAFALFGYRSYLIGELRKPVLAKLNDPDSAQFQSEKIVGPWLADKSIYCGKINAKNHMGGYVGYAWFSGDSQGVLIEGPTEKETFDKAGIKRCDFSDDDTVKWWWLRW